MIKAATRSKKRIKGPGAVRAITYAWGDFYHEAITVMRSGFLAVFKH